MLFLLTRGESGDALEAESYEPDEPHGPDEPRLQAAPPKPQASPPNPVAVMVPQAELERSRAETETPTG